MSVFLNILAHLAYSVQSIFFISDTINKKTFFLTAITAITGRVACLFLTSPTGQRCVRAVSLCADIQIVEKREAPLLGSRVSESEDHAQWHEKKIKLCF